jgi:hypothetical protein
VTPALYVKTKSREWRIDRSGGSSLEKLGVPSRKPYIYT